MHQKKKKLFLLLVGPIVVCIGVFLLLNMFSTSRQPTHVVFSSPLFTNEWMKLEFTAIQDTIAFRSQLAKIKQEGGSQMSPDEARAWDSLLFNFLFYHHSDEFDYYRNFRFGSPDGQFVKSVVDTDRDMLGKLGLNVPVASMDVLEQFWEHIEMPERKRAGGQWAEIALPDATLTVEVSSYWPAPLGEMASRRPNVGVLTHFSYYQPRPTPQDLLKQNGEIKIATFHAIIRQANQTPAPVYLRSYFEPRTKEWIPWEFVSAGPDNFFNSVY